MTIDIPVIYFEFCNSQISNQKLIELLNQKSQDSYCLFRLLCNHREWVINNLREIPEEYYPICIGCGIEIKEYFIPNEYLLNNKKFRIHFILLDDTSVIPLQPDEISLAIKSQSKRITECIFLLQKEMLQHDQIFDLCLSSDQPEKIDFSLSKSQFRELVKRLVHLHHHHRDYFNTVSKKYNQYLIRTRDEYFSSASHKNLMILDHYFPNLFEIQIKKCTPITFTLMKQTLFRQGYLLGYRYPQYLEKSSIIKNRVELFNNDPNIILEKTREENKQMILNEIGNLKLLNEIDTLGNSIYDYSPFDLVIFCDLTHGYVFTRPEFNYLIDNGKNIYTLESLPQQFIKMVEMKYKWSMKYLYSPETLSDLYSKLVSKELIVPEINEDRQEVNIITLLNILNT